MGVALLLLRFQTTVVAPTTAWPWLVLENWLVYEIPDHGRGVNHELAVVGSVIQTTGVASTTGWPWLTLELGFVL